jgi:hypothetical protein
MSDLLPERRSEIILYQTEDGQSRIQVRLEGATVWLTQALMAELFQTTPQNITIHIRGIYKGGELAEEGTCKECLQVRHEGGRRCTSPVVQNEKTRSSRWRKIRVKRKTNFDRYLEQHLSESEFAGRFRKAGESWDKVMRQSNARETRRRAKGPDRKSRI